MGKVISLINTTPDGFVDSHYVIADAEFHEFVHTLLANARSVAFGKNTFELFQQIWPGILEKEGQHESQVRMAKALGAIPKIAYSSKLESTTWSNSSIVSVINAEQIARKKKDSDKDLLTIGSPGLVASLTELKLVDDYYFCIQPVIAGGGNARLFDKIALEAKQPLKFVAAKQLQSGVVIIHYQRVS